MALVASVGRIFECDDLMLYKNKPAISPGQDIRTLPTYTIPEAAQYLSIDPWTLLDWYSKRDPVLKPSGWYGDVQAFALLSFENLEEAYKVHLLRTKFHYSMQYLRKALVDARRESGSDHPLIDPKCRMYVFDSLAIEKSGRGRRPGSMVPLGARHKPLYIGEVVKTWGTRIITDSKGRTKQIFPWRFAAQDDHSRPVSLQPDVMSGRLVVTGTRIPATVLLHRRREGESIERIAKDYSLPPDLVRKALSHFDKKTSRTVRTIS
jgi:uncharacterized protein (DUF433 family)